MRPNRRPPLTDATYKPAKGTKDYTKRAQCAAIRRKGRLAGKRCGWYVEDDSIYCKKHGQFAGHQHTPENLAKSIQGLKNWHARIREIEKTQPGTMRRIFGGSGVKYGEKQISPKLEPVVAVMPKPETDDKQVIKAHKEMVKAVASLPMPPDKPFERMEAHERLDVLTGISMIRINEILQLPIKDRNGIVDPKLASLVKDTALRTLATRVKVDTNALKARKVSHMQELLAKLKGFVPDAPKVIEGEVEKSD